MNRDRSTLRRPDKAMHPKKRLDLFRRPTERAYGQDAKMAESNAKPLFESLAYRPVAEPPGHLQFPYYCNPALRGLHTVFPEPKRYLAVR